MLGGSLVDSRLLSNCSLSEQAEANFHAHTCNMPIPWYSCLNPE